MTAHAYFPPDADVQRFLKRLGELWPEGDDPSSNEILLVAEDAVEQCAHSAHLWYLRGQLIALADDDAPYELSDALLSWEAAVRVDEDHIESHEAIADFCINAIDDLPRAETALRAAAQLGGGPWVYADLARVLAQQQRLDEAMTILHPDQCPYGDDPLVEQTRELIAQGQFSGNDEPRS